MEGGTTSTVQTAITGMAQTVVDQGIATLNAVLPVMAPLVATVIVAGLGYMFIKKFRK